MVDTFPSIHHIPVLPQIYFLTLQRLEETLRLSVIIGIAFPAHTDADPMLPKSVRICVSGILHASVRMVDQARVYSSGRQSHAQGSQCQSGLQGVVQCPANTAPADDTRLYQLHQDAFAPQEAGVLLR